MAQAARRKLQGDEDGARAFKEEASLLKEQKRKYLQRAGYPDDYMEMQYHMPLLPGHRLCRRKKMPLLPPDGDPGPL